MVTLNLRLFILAGAIFTMTSCQSMTSGQDAETESATLIDPLASIPESERPRVLVLTDIGNEPDDAQSLVRYLVYSNEFDTQGILATTSTWLRDEVQRYRIEGHIKAYSDVRANLMKHKDGYPEAEELMSKVKSCPAIYGMGAVGAGHDSEGSEHIIEVVDHEDDRPVWVSVWGGANCLAQALWKVRSTRSEEELARFVSKMKVYTISDQDDSGPWMRKEFPDLYFIVSPSDQGGDDYPTATWVGISGDKFHGNFKGPNFDLVSNQFHLQNIRSKHGPLGKRYPATKYLTEGDTPSFLGLINNGLAWHHSPSYGGWGGRYNLLQPEGESRPIWTNVKDKVTAFDGEEYETNHATIWRWREGYQNDFAARMDWNVAESFEGANHNPFAVLNGDESLEPISLELEGPGQVKLSAEGSSDPDSDQLRYRWFIYHEAGSFQGKSSLRFPNYTGARGDQGLTAELIIKEIESPGDLHVILEIIDNGDPTLHSYRRAIISIRET